MITLVHVRHVKGVSRNGAAMTCAALATRASRLKIAFQADGLSACARTPVFLRRSQRVAARMRLRARIAASGQRRISTISRKKAGGSRDEVDVYECEHA